MRNPSHRPFLLLAAAVLSAACGEGAYRLDPTEWLPGGETTNTLLLGPNAFLLPAQNLAPEDEQDFYSGNSFFNQAWVQAPASTESRDGLGPLFNARSCSGCHFRDGKGAPPDDGQGPFVGLLLRASVPGPDGPQPDPVYGGQLQDQALDGLPPEVVPRITWQEQAGSFDDGTAYSLAAPTYHLDQPGYGAVSGDLMVSPRVAPHMIGLGLLEAIPEVDLVALEDPDDVDGDGISGRLQRHTDGRIGRFGWKADAVNVAEQVAGAFVGDMGLTSRLAPVDDCTEAQPDCLTSLDGGDPEVTDRILDLVVLYSQAVAVPARRQAEDPTILEGGQRFRDIGCASCHTPRHLTGASDLPGMNDQVIWPYTDLLLHDMGPGLADGRPVASASGQEWKTPPLWSMGLIQSVSGHTRYLHDGRARNLEEAVLWHGGEAQASADAFRALSPADRAALLAFVEDL